MEAASAQMLRSTAVGTYGMVHALRPQGKDWQAYQAVRPRAHLDMGRFDKTGPFPNEVLEIQIGTAHSKRRGLLLRRSDYMVFVSADRPGRCCLRVVRAPRQGPGSWCVRVCWF